jgi:hypothetical protein
MDGVTTPDAPPTYGPYLPYEPPPPPPAPDPRKRRVLIAVTAAWALLLTVSAVWYSLHGRPTAREQTTIASAEPTVTRVTQEVVRAVAGTSVVPAFSGFEKVRDCDVTAARSGAEYERVLWLYTPVGSEPALLDRIADGLPDRYDARVFHSPGGAVHTLSADAGNFVAVTGSVLLPGLVRVRAGTGCRPLGSPPSADPTTTPAENPLQVNGSWQAHTLPCGLRTVVVTGPAGRSWSTLPGSGSVVSTPEVWAGKDGRAAHIESGKVTWTVTTGTCG